MKRLVSVLFALVLLVLVSPTVHAYSGPASSYNNYGHWYVNVQRWASPIHSVLEKTQNGYTRVERIDERIVIEQYNSNLQYTSGKEIQLELPLYGGIYLADDYNFLVVGQENLEENDEKEVFRIIRYSKDWVRQASVSIYGANTTTPFAGGTLRFARSGNMLYIRTCHEMYADEDDINHQANVMIAVRISDMTGTDQLTDVLNSRYGYVSHSFNQFLLVDGSTLLAVDHGDYYPRSVALFKYGKPAGSETFYSPVTMVNALSITDSTYHYNDTGVSLGGFDCSSSHYLIAGHSADQSTPSHLMIAQRNIFVTATPKNNFTDEATAIYWLTDYSTEDEVAVSPPHLVKIGSDSFLLTWTEDDVLKYCFLNGKGELSGSIQTGEGALSDCVPILDGNRVLWYVTDDSAPVFYQIDLSSAEIPHTHKYTAVITAPTCTEGGYTTYTCNICGDNYTGNSVAATGHSWDDGLVTKEATEDENGEILYTCTLCGKTQTKELKYTSIVRLFGSGRCKTAIEVAEKMKQTLDIEKFDAIIIANGDNFADALAGSYLATRKQAPILLYRASAVAENLDYILQNLSEDGTVYLLGGTAAVPASVADGLTDAGVTVKRLAGSSRFDTNLEILKEAGITDGQEILVATGYEFADSLSASATGLPILMVNNGLGALTDAQITFLESLKDCTFTVIGGTSAVSDTLKDAIGEYGPVTRLSGKNREATSVLVAETYFQAPEQVVLAYSRNFPDGLCGGPLAHLLGAPLILTNAGQEAAAAAYVADNGIISAIVLGGTSALSNKTVNTVFGLTP